MEQRAPGDALLTLDVSGHPGDDGRDGADGAPGSDHGWGAPGQPGTDAGPAQPGQCAGEIHLTLTDGGDGMITVRGTMLPPDGPRQPVDATRYVGEAGSLLLRALGGGGGRGGDGGHGGPGAQGAPGNDGTEYRRGTDGGPGGDGGDGGDASTGGDGGRGGTITLSVATRDTALLMLVEHAVAGGRGGAAGRNGRGGDGGHGGRGGSSHWWTETDSDGDTRHCSNAGGSTGPAGPGGRPGDAGVRDGARGDDGALTIDVPDAASDGAATYRSRYDLHLCHFVHLDASADDVYEPGEELRLRAVSPPPSAPIDEWKDATEDYANTEYEIGDLCKDLDWGDDVAVLAKLRQRFDRLVALVRR